MAVSAPPPNPSLVAIILVVQARPGPRFVYHYPPSPLSRQTSNRKDARSVSCEDSTDSDEESTSASDEDFQSDGYSKGSSRPKWAGATDEEDEDSPSPGTDDQKHGGWLVPWEHLLGLDASALERLLMPSDRSWHRRRFEVGFNELVFLGWPVFIREDGTWRKKRRKGKVASDKTREGAVGESVEGSSHAEDNAQDKFGDPLQGDAASSVETDNTTANREESREMTIFNVVFVLNPPILEYTLRIKEMYDHVVKKLGRALKWEQARDSYVWKQSEIILKAKAKARHKSLFPRSWVYSSF